MWTAIILCAALGIATAALSVKTVLIKKSAREIAAGFRDKVKADTNTRIDISSGDRDMRALAAAVNEQLDALRAARLRYTHGDRELKEAVTNISHDLRTPLTAVNGYLQLLEQENLPPVAAGYLSVIAQRIDGLKALTEELFKYSVILSADDELHPERVNVGDLLENILLGYYAALTGRGIEVETDIAETAVLRTLDRGAAARVFGNIIGNALKYSDGDLRVSMDAAGTIRFSNRAKALDEVSAGKLFDRFFTVQSGRHSTGLGLSIARTLTERMGGTIVSGYADGRLTITLSFPDDADTAPQSGRESA